MCKRVRGCQGARCVGVLLSWLKRSETKAAPGLIRIDASRCSQLPRARREREKAKAVAILRLWGLHGLSFQTHFLRLGGAAGGGPLPVPAEPQGTEGPCEMRLRSCRCRAQNQLSRLRDKPCQELRQDSKDPCPRHEQQTEQQHDEDDFDNLTTKAQECGIVQRDNMVGHRNWKQESTNDLCSSLGPGFFKWFSVSRNFQSAQAMASAVQTKTAPHELYAR